MSEIVFQGDHVVIGFTVAGVAAAHELASQGHSVCLVDTVGGSAMVADLAVIDPTPLHAEEVSGSEFYATALEVLTRAGVTLDTRVFPTRTYVETASSQLLLVNGDERAVRVRSAVFAPYGTPPDLPEPLGAARLWGVGLSRSAWSDGRFFEGQPVAVLGCGAWALHQAWIASQWASRTVVLCESPALGAPTQLRNRVIARAGMEIKEGVTLTSLLTNEQHHLCGIRWRENGDSKTMAASGLFVAGDPVIDWSLWGGYDGAKELARMGRLFLGGSAASVDYWDHAAQFQDGVRAAKEAMRSDYTTAN